MFKLISYLFLLFCTVKAQSQNIGIGTTTPNSKLDINGDIALRSTTINIASTYTYALDVNTVKQANYRLTDNNAVGNFILAGITASADGRQITLYNRTGSSMQIFDEDATAIADNRIRTGINTALAIYNGGVVSLRYDTTVHRWEVTNSHYSSLDYFGGGGGSGNWDASGPDIYNSNTGNVGVGTTTPAAKLTVNGNFALISDTVKIDCSFFPSKMIIDNVAKNKSVYHIINDGCSIYTPPILAGLTGGTDGRIITVISHINNLQVLHLAANTILPSAADSLNMIELYEPNSNGAINQPYAYTLNNGGSFTFQYDAIRNKWKLLTINGEIKQDMVSWSKGANPNDIYNPNSNNVGIGTGSPTQKLDIAGNARVRNSLYIDGNTGIGTSTPSAKLDVNGNGKVRGNWVIDSIATIGNGSASFTLNVKSNGVGISQESPDGSTKAGFYVNNGFAYVQTHTNHPLLFTTNNGNEQMRLQPNGNFGIGTNFPNASLSVTRGTGTDGTAAFFGTTNASHFNYSTAEDTYIRGGKVTSKLLLNDYGGQVALGTATTGNAQLNIVSSRTGGNANGLSINQATTNTGNDSYGLYTYAGGSNQNNIGIKSEVSSSGLTANLAGMFLSDAGGTTGNNKGIFARAAGSSTGNIAGQFETSTGGSLSQNYGVYATAVGMGPNYGVYCAGVGTYGQQAGVPNYGIYAVGPSQLYSGYAGFFDGNVFVSGLVLKSGGTFTIDHPQDPANKILNHSFVESPDMMNVYNGNAITDAMGNANIALPDYFMALNKDYRYQLTVIGQPAQVWVQQEISNNKFVIKSDKPNVKVSWQVTGIRQDAWANAHRIVPEVEKQGRDKGKYLTPEVFGKPAEMGIHYVKPMKEKQQ